MTETVERTDVRTEAIEIDQNISQLSSRYQTSESPYLQEIGRNLDNQRKFLEATIETGRPGERGEIGSALTIGELDKTPEALDIAPEDRWPLELAIQRGFIRPYRIEDRQITLTHPEKPLVAKVKMGWQHKRAPQFVWDEYKEFIIVSDSNGTNGNGQH